MLEKSNLKDNTYAAISNPSDIEIGIFQVK